MSKIYLKRCNCLDPNNNDDLLVFMHKMAGHAASDLAAKKKNTIASHLDAWVNAFIDIPIATTINKDIIV